MIPVQESHAAPPPASVAAVLSMLHEPAGRADSAARLFRGKPVLAWTLERLRRARRVETITVLCWDDQAEAVVPIADARGAYVLAKGPRGSVPAVDAVAAARRWADGWRGGLLGTCECDRGFHAAWVAEVADQLSAAAVVLVDPSAGLVDPQLIDGLIEHADAAPDTAMVFSQAAPGLSGVLLRDSLLTNLTKAGLCPGKILHYLPDAPARDPIAGDGCAPVATPLARTLHRFTLDSRRQVQRIARATLGLNGQLMGTAAEGLLHALDRDTQVDPLPREVVLELTSRRSCRPIFSPHRHLGDGGLDRPDFTAEMARRLFGELAGMDDVRVTLAGAGDPLLAADFVPIVEAARAAGIHALRIETDLIGADDARVAALAAAAVDVVSVHLPAVTEATYAAVMGLTGEAGVGERAGGGASGLAAAVERVRLLLRHREALRRATPIIVPLFVKCRENLAEMEAWYDQWLRVLGAAVVVGPSDFAGQIPDAGVADMAPLLRRPCARLTRRLTILSDGKIVACEQDVRGRFPVGRIGKTPLTEAWGERMADLRADHAAGAWGRHALCAGCREWHRP